MTEVWSQDLLESDRRYFEAGADLVAIPGGVIARLRGAESLAAGCVVQRIDRDCAGADPGGWLSLVEQRLRDLGSPRARLYLDGDPGDLDAELRRRGYRPRDEHGFVRAADEDGEGEIELVPADDEASWSARRELVHGETHGVDGHPIDAARWVALERRKCESGYMRPLLIRKDGRIAGAVCAAPIGRLLRLKNLVVDTAFRRRGIARATAVAFTGLARKLGIEAAGCFALAGEPGLRVYPQAGYRECVIQTEWVKALS